MFNHPLKAAMKPVTVPLINMQHQLQMEIQRMAVGSFNILSVNPRIYRIFFSRGN